MKSQKLTLAEVVAALGQMTTEDFPNRAACVAACQLIDAVKNAGEVAAAEERVSKAMRELKTKGEG